MYALFVTIYITIRFQTAQRTHMDKMTKFVQLHMNRVHALENEFERDLKALKLEFNTETDMIRAQHGRETKEMKGIINQVEAQEAERIAQAKQEHETEREEIRNKNLEGINELRINLENKIEDLEKQFDDAHQNYVENTDQANKHFKVTRVRTHKHAHNHLPSRVHSMLTGPFSARAPRRYIHVGSVRCLSHQPSILPFNPLHHYHLRARRINTISITPITTTITISIFSASSGTGNSYTIQWHLLTAWKANCCLRRC